MAGRPENPLDPSAGPVQLLAFELRKLRAEAGSPPYRVMAKRAGQGASTLSQAAAGERLPTLPTVLAYVKACGGDPQAWEQRWRQAARELAEEPRDGQDDDAAPPYRGLRRFEPADRHLFFGRDTLTRHLTGIVAQHRLTAVVGASGSGKSSLLRAGLVPALQDAASGSVRPAAIRILTPGEHPAARLGLLEPADGEGDTVVVIDQFEELFTLVTNPAERTAFLDHLLAACAPGGRLRAVLAVRADFFGRCAEHPALAAALRDATVLAGPMSAAELREAVVKPAQSVGLIVERDLTQRVLDDVAGEPGSLPLMSHALLETWRRRRGRTLTLEMYQATGGIHGAITTTAEDAYTRLTPPKADLARRILLRLITPGDGTPDTRRPTPRTELDFADPDNTAHVLEHLARARLLTLENDTVDLAHEALIAAWPRLQAWINETRDRLRLHRQLTEAAHAWDTLHRDPGALYRGTRLTAAEDTFLTSDTVNDLTSVERDFLTNSITTRRREEEAAGRTTRRLRQFTATLSILLVLSLAAGLIAWQQYRTSEQQRHQALTAQHIALSRQLAAQSSGLLQSDPDLASLLAVQAYRTNPTKEATASLFAAAALPLKHRLTGHMHTVDSVAFSPDGHTFASGDGGGTIRLWDSITGKLRATLRDSDGVSSVAFSPDGRTIAAGNDAGVVRLWDASSGRARVALAKCSDASAVVAFSPEGRALASCETDDGTVIWDVAAGKRRTVLTSSSAVRPVAFSPDGRTLASGGDNGPVRLWDAITGKPRAPLTKYGELSGYVNLSAVVAFSPDGRTLASAEGDKVRLWDVKTGKPRLTLPGWTDLVQSLAFSPDGRTLAAGGFDMKVRLWNVATGQLQTTFTGHTSPVTTLAFSPDGRTLASGSVDKTVRLWAIAANGERTLIGHTDQVNSVAFSSDGHTLASGGEDRTLRLWDTVTGELLATREQSAPVGAVASSPYGHTVASRTYDSVIQLLDTTTNRSKILTQDAAPFGSLAFSPDGRSLASAEYDKIRIWDTETGKLSMSMTKLKHAVISVAFSPDGRTLASGSQDKTVRLWDVATGKLRTVLIGNSDAVNSVAFSPDGHTLASSSKGPIPLWQTATGKIRTTLPGYTGGVASVAFSPDGRTLASEDAATVRLWDVPAGKLRTSLSGHTAPVRSLAFSPDGHTLASGSLDHTIRLWDVSLPDPTASIKQICQAVHRDLSPAERSQYL